jgi:hypothetical protein
VFAAVRIIIGARAERGAAEVERHAIEPALLFVERAVDPRELVLGQGIDAEPFLDLREAVVVRIAEGREGALHLVHCRFCFGQKGFRFHGIHGVTRFRWLDGKRPPGAKPARDGSRRR